MKVDLFEAVKEKALAEADRDEKSGETETVPGKGREFYTIMTKTGKVFYLVIDRTKDEETVHFLTDITENDLLNVTQDNKPTLPQNSAVVIKDAGLTAGSGRDGEEKAEKPEQPEASETGSVSEDSLLMDDGELTSEEAEPGEAMTPLQTFLRKYGSLMAIGLISLIVIIGYIIMRFIKRDDDEDYVEDEEAEDDDEEYAMEQEQEEESGGENIDGFMESVIKEEAASRDESEKAATESNPLVKEQQTGQVDSGSQPIPQPSMQMETQQTQQTMKQESPPVPKPPSQTESEPIYSPYRRDETKDEPIYTATGSTIPDNTPDTADTTDNESEEIDEEEEGYA